MGSRWWWWCSSSCGSDAATASVCVGVVSVWYLFGNCKADRMDLRKGRVFPRSAVGVGGWENHPTAEKRGAAEAN